MSPWKTSPPAVVSTALVVFGWSYFILTNSVATIWPMFGMANQLLALIALTIVTTVLVNSGRGRFAPVTLLPMAFVASTTLTTAFKECSGKYCVWIRQGQIARGSLNLGMTLLLVGCVAVLVGSALLRWWKVLRKGSDVDRQVARDPRAGDHQFFHWVRRLLGLGHAARRQAYERNAGQKMNPTESPARPRI